MISYKDELQHSGILGMHWGIRRYRNYDGTLTSAGKERYNYSDGSKSSKKSETKPSRSERKISKAREAKREAKQAAKEAKKATEELRKEREALEAERAKMTEKDLIRERRDIQKLSNEELQTYIDRIKLEREYDALLNPPSPETKSAMARAKAFLNASGEAAKNVTLIAKAAEAIKKAKNASASSST